MTARPTKPARAPHRTTRRRPKHPPVPPTTPTVEAPKPLTGGGGASGFGPIDEDGGDKRPDRDGDNSRPFLLVILGILVMGAGVLTARVLAESSGRRRSAFRR